MKFNPGKSAYAEERYTKEARRLWSVLDRLAEHEYVADDYSIADIAIWPWISRFEWQTVTFDDYPNVKRWYVAIAARPAVQGHGMYLPVIAAFLCLDWRLGCSGTGGSYGRMPLTKPAR